ncbi:DUF1194 domain-containing protein [Pseudooceanicola sp. C21-150M6]|uniref:DUF1194 domain-containing protein n=1 Tax=Pseudooceanicola sp. C21-150M6 TaxID=3434355 RepID=UPI003D7F9F48
MVRLFSALAAILIGAGTAQAECRLALVLALDVSASVDEGEYRLQRDGLAAALDRPEIRQAILTGAPGHVALSVFEWSGRYHQHVALEWMALTDTAAIDQAVARLASVTRSYSNMPTAVGYALGYSSGLLRRGPDCARQVVDLSGDGINNEGFGPELAYRNFPFDGVTVNGLVIEGRNRELVTFYDQEVLRGPDAFLELASGFDEFAEAMARKLYRELGGLSVGALEDETRAPG